MQMFQGSTGRIVPSVTSDQMRELDRIAVEEFGLQILQMMENAGRNVAQVARGMLPRDRPSVVVLAGGGGNGGGGLAAARHLDNHGVQVDVAFDRDPAGLRGPAAVQWRTLQAAGIQAVPNEHLPQAIREAGLVVDALLGYGLQGAPRERTRLMIEACNRCAHSILSLDVPSGLDATSGEAPGAVVRPNRILTLALPKTGLAHPDVDLSELYLADIGIPRAAVERLGIDAADPFLGSYVVRLACVGERLRPCREQR